uniref:Uncharacterized protein n=1 Tax=Romanomermis culicivorax TaxID=13658 RepID=A0A915JAN9_ROMCU
MPSEITVKIQPAIFMPLNRQQSTFAPTLTIFLVNANGDHAAERHLKVVQTPHTFSQTEGIEAEQAVPLWQPSAHQPPSQNLEVRELAKPIFLIAQASVSISPHCQQWMTSTVFTTTTATIPQLIVQLLATNNVAQQFPIETAIVNVTNDVRSPKKYILYDMDNGNTQVVTTARE